jgi:hypothetical protein
MLDYDSHNNMVNVLAYHQVDIFGEHSQGSKVELLCITAIEMRSHIYDKCSL